MKKLKNGDNKVFKASMENVVKGFRVRSNPSNYTGLSVWYIPRLGENKMKGKKTSYSHIDSCKPYPKQDDCHCVFAYGSAYELCPDCLGTGKQERMLSLYEKGIKSGHKPKSGFDYEEDKTPAYSIGFISYDLDFGDK